MPPWFNEIPPILGLEGTLWQRVAGTLAALLLVWIARWLILAVVQPRLETARAHFWWRKAATYTAIVVSILLAGRIWFSGFSDVATVLGLLSAGVAVALRDWISNFFGWLYILTWRPYGVGDRIQVGDAAGDVIDVGLFSTSLLEIGNWVQADQSTGRLLHVPNGRIMTKTVANYTAGMAYLWHELPVLVTFESNWRAAKAILTRIATASSAETVAEARADLAETSKRHLISYGHLTPIVYTAIRDSGVQLTIRYLTPPRRRRGTEEALWEAILDAFGERDDIDFAYPTTRLYDNVAEGKPEARAEGPPRR